MRRAARLAVALAALALAALGCGRGGGRLGPVDAGGDGTLDIVSGPPATSGAFDVVASLKVQQKGVVPPKDTATFTLLLDVEHLTISAGGRGRVATVPVTTSDGHAFHSIAPLLVGDLSPACAGPSGSRFDVLDFVVSGGTLRGTATGADEISCGDCSIDEPFTGELVGSADTTAPTLAGGTIPTSPFDRLGVLTSEPLPATAKARLVASDGSRLDLVPVPSDVGPAFVVGFDKPDVVLAPGQGYAVETSGLVDFAGNPGAADGLLRVVAFPATPLVPEDGFESAAGPTLGGAAVLTGPSPFVLTGTKSLVVGAGFAARLGAAAPGGATLLVRLAVQTGDTTLRFSYRTLDAPDPTLAGQVFRGSVGHQVGAPTFLASGGSEGTMTSTGGMVALGAPQTAEVALPADVTDELLVSISSVLPSMCSDVVAPSGGLILDDLRVE